MADKYISSAKLVDGILILSLPDAVSPVVWQMEMGQSKSSALEIRTGDGGIFILTLKTPRQDILDIAHYADKDKALRALMVVSDAMEKAQGHLRKGSGNLSAPAYPLPTLLPGNGKASSFFKKLLGFSAKLVGGLLVIGVLIFLVLFAGQFFASGKNAAPAASGGGAPMSADDFLNSR